MPRKKTIDKNQIKLEKINEEIIEKKNCLGVKLVFNTPLSQRYWHTMRTFYRINVDATGQTATRSVKNSWKGLVMLLLSLVYCKLGNRTVGILVSKIDYTSEKYRPDLTISWEYDVFLSPEEIYKTQATRLLDNDDDLLLMVKAFHDKELKAELAERNRRWQKEMHKKLLMELPPNPSIEQIAVPPSWRACYFKTSTNVWNMLGNIMMLGSYLDIDMKKSVVDTEPCGETPFKYSIFPAKFQDTSGLLCSCPDEFGFVHGIEIVDNDGFSSLMSGNQAQQIDVAIPPNQLVQTDASIFGYNLTPGTMGQLCTYFPFMESEFCDALATMCGNAWVIFDSEHLGRWG